MTSPIIIREVQRVIVTAPGPQGPPGTGSGSSFYHEHVQAVPAATWIVDHNLGSYPNVSILIDGVVSQTDITHNTANQTSIVFPAPLAGRAIFS